MSSKTNPCPNDSMFGSTTSSHHISVRLGGWRRNCAVTMRHSLVLPVCLIGLAAALQGAKTARDLVAHLQAECEHRLIDGEHLPQARLHIVSAEVQLVSGIVAGQEQRTPRIDIAHLLPLLR